MDDNCNGGKDYSDIQESYIIRHASPLLLMRK